MDYKKIPSPCYVLDEKLLIKNLELISRVQNEAGIEIILALKGFALWSAFPIIGEYVKGATASSLYEARLVYEEMHNFSHVFSPVYRSDEFEELLQYSSHIVFNSIAQFNEFYPRTLKAKHKISCGLRVNPEESDVETDLYNPSSPKSRLGILNEHLPIELPNGIEGLHFHVLCESDSYALENVLYAFEQRFGKYLAKLKWLNIGGGHLITKQGYNVEHLIKLLITFRQKHNVQVIMEPGSAFAWDTGVLVAQVLDIVQSRGVKTAMLDVSFTAHMPDTLEMPYRPAIEGAKKPNNNSKYAYRLGGISCLAGDFMEEYDFGRELLPGDRVIFKDMMHYTMVKTTMFNGVKHPSIGIWTKNNQFKLIREFGYFDFKNRLS